MEQTAAERLVDEGRLVHHALKQKCPLAVRRVKGMSSQKRVLALLVYRASKDFPALVFKAIMEGWSAFRIRFEIDKRIKGEIPGD